MLNGLLSSFKGQSFMIIGHPILNMIDVIIIIPLQEAQFLQFYTLKSNQKKVFLLALATNVVGAVPRPLF